MTPAPAHSHSHSHSHSQSARRFVGGFFTASSLALVTGSLAMAAPVEFDTEAAHVIVVRPVDVWSGDAGAQDDSLDMVKARRANYVLEITYNSYLRGGPLWLQGASDHPVVDAVREALKPHGFALRPNQGYYFVIHSADTVEPEKFEAVRAAQAAVYKQTIVDQGDPDTLRRRILGRKVAGNVLSLLTLGIAGGAYGTTGVTAALGSGIAGEAYQVPAWVPHVLAPAYLPPLDATAFKAIDMRRLDFRAGMVGQIVIAYRGEKTPEAETEALVKAIVAATGADTTPETIEAARASDLVYRQSVWKECVASGKCGPTSDKKTDVTESAKAVQ